MEKYFAFSDKALFSDEIESQYDPEKEHIQNANYVTEMKLRQLKRSM